MDIAIIDADLEWRKKHRFPNLACMKLSAYYKMTGNNVVLEKNYDKLHNYDKILILFSSNGFTSINPRYFFYQFTASFLDGKDIGTTVFLIKSVHLYRDGYSLLVLLSVQSVSIIILCFTSGTFVSRFVL